MNESTETSRALQAIRATSEEALLTAEERELAYKYAQQAQMQALSDISYRLREVFEVLATDCHDWFSNVQGFDRINFDGDAMLIVTELAEMVEADRTELVVTRQNHEPVVVMPLAELEGLRETLHLLSTPANAEHLRASIAELDAGKGKPRKLAE